MAVEACNMGLVLSIKWKWGFFIKMVIFQSVLTAVKPVEAKKANSFVLNKITINVFRKQFIIPTENTVSNLSAMHLTSKHLRSKHLRKKKNV